MGVVNLTPDSFYDGGLVDARGGAARIARRLLDEGADILDLGAESTRPGAVLINAHEEIARLAPALDAVRREAPDAVLSVDTWRAESARFAIERGVALVNDVSGLADPSMTDVLAEYKPAYCLTHSRGVPAARGADSADIIGEIQDFFERKLTFLTNAGLPEDHILLDCGVGFGKSSADTLKILANIDKFLIFDRPLLVGLSMKSFFKDFLGKDLRERGPGVAAAIALLRRSGVFWHRVHDVRAARDALLLALALSGETERSHADIPLRRRGETPFRRGENVDEF